MTINNSNSGTDVITVCDFYTWIDGNTYTTSTNEPVFTLTNTAGCDSIVTLDLTINSVSNTAVTQNADMLTADLTGTNVFYQWLDCVNNYSPIPNQTDQLFVAQVNGNYAVQITEGQCVDTSACYSILEVGIDDNDVSFNVTIYPNPSNDGLFSISSDEIISSVACIDILGRTVPINYDSNTNVIDASNLFQGKYMIKIFTERGMSTQQVVIQH